MRTQVAHFAVLLVLLLGSPVFADDKGLFGEESIPRDFSQVADIKVEVSPAKAKRGETVKFKFTVIPKPGAWTYPTVTADADQPSKNRLALPKTPGEVIFVSKVFDPTQPPLHLKPRDDKDPNGPKDQYYTDPVTWELDAVVSPQAKPGSASVGLGQNTHILVCTKDTCLWPRKYPTATLEILDGEVPVDPKYQAAVVKALGTPLSVVPGDVKVGPPPQAVAKEQPLEKPAHASSAKTAKSIEHYKAGLDEAREQLDTSDAKPPEQKLGMFLLTAVIWGLVSLVTPCVFPMIPITVSIFLKHAHGSFQERMKLAGVYCVTIILVLGLSAFVLLKFMAWLSTNPITNILLGSLFVVLALSLFGMYELALPNFISRRLQAKQAKGGTVGTIFGALAFTVISFTCVAPFLGGFAGISAADSGSDSLIAIPTARDVLGGLAFATAFAAPFFVLAMVPGLLKSLPKSGGWLDSVKVVMGFLELAAALKFFRTAELRSPFGLSYFTYDLVLAGWVAISFACGLYLLNAFRLPHDEEKPNIGVPRLLFAVLFIGLGFYLLPGTFKASDGSDQRPKGAVFAWVDAFLLPDEKTSKTEVREQEKGLLWGSDLKDAMDQSRESKARGQKPRPIFVDFTGKTCSNCRLNERNIFPLSEVQNLLREYQLVQLYTDEVPESTYAVDPGFDARRDEARANDDFKYDKQVFGTGQLPLYVVLVPEPSGKYKAEVYKEGAINNKDAFLAFLKNGIAEAGK